jgi:CopG family transcriptional regulator, nickel-responsive regulator
MSSLQRFSVSVEKDILNLIDRQVRSRAYPNRSDALRAIIRAHAAQQEAAGQGEVLGILGVVYDHHKPNLVNRMLHAQHDTAAKILGAQHHHLDHRHCVESILARGKARDLDHLQKSIQRIRGIKYASLLILSPAKHPT